MSEVAGASSPRRRWLSLVVLTVSLALNLFFIGVVVGSMPAIQRDGGPRDRFERIVGRLNLSPSQKSMFREFQIALRQRGSAMHKANTVIWSKVAEPATKPEEISTLLGSALQNRSVFEQDSSKALANFLGSLTPEQRAGFVREARASPHPRGPLHRLRELAR